MADLVERLQIDAACLRKMVDHANLAGPQTDVRVKRPDLLLDSLSEAATEIESLRRENQELRAAVIEECAKVAERMPLLRPISTAHVKTTTPKDIATAIRALTMSDIHSEQLDRPRVDPADRREAE